MRLIDTIRREKVENFHLLRLQIIDGTNFDPVRAKVKADLSKQGTAVSELWLDKGILALKQYYAIAVLDPLNKHAVSDAVDPFWHAHILHTADYITFCQNLTGEYFHHTPLDHAAKEKVAAVGSLYRYTRACYAHFFTHIDVEFFPPELTEERLVCLHQDVKAPELRARALLPYDAGLSAAAALV